MTRCHRSSEGGCSRWRNLSVKRQLVGSGRNLPPSGDVEMAGDKPGRGGRELVGSRLRCGSFDGTLETPQGSPVSPA
jgi:hypothetical protein